MLRHAVNGTQAIEQGGTGNPYDLSFGKERAQDAEGFFVVRVIVHGSQNSLVGDVKVRIASWEPFTAIFHSPR